MPPVGFEPTISAGERPNTYALERAATGTGIVWHYITLKYIISEYQKIIYPVLTLIRDISHEIKFKEPIVLIFL